MPVPVIVLPAQFKGLTLSKVARAVIDSSPEWPPASINFDFSALSFIRPAGIVFLSNLISWLHHQGAEVTLTGMGGASRAIWYLDDSLFFEQHCGRKLNPNACPRSTTRPLVRIAHKDSHAWLQTKLVPWLATRLAISEASLYAFKTCVSELFNNIQDHTQYDIGSIFVQHFPHEHGVTISLSDFGPGIPARVRERLPNISDAGAITQAVQDGFTTKSNPGNKGAGLDYLLRTVVVGNGGQVTIYSGGSIVRFVQDGTRTRPIPFENVGFCPGTTIDLSLRTTTIEVLPEESEELQW
jgi:anti-sigma regulatory factor (Ser/Thr protein kinase)